MLEPSPRRRLLQVAGLFLKLGTISIGGPTAHIALMEQEAVRRRGWLTHEHFLDLLAATNLVPGPNATEMAIHIGYVRAGWLGLLASGLGFILPGFLISLALAIGYVQGGALPQVVALFYGIKPVVMAIILDTLYRLGRTALKDKRSIGLAVACLAAALLGLNDVWVLLAAGVAGLALYMGASRLKLAALLGGVQPAWGALPQLSGWLDHRLTQLGLYFLKVGSLMFGSGMVLFAFVQRDVVGGYGWLTQHQLLDAIAIGQMTPGPVLSAVTVIGYLVAGVPGSIVATAAVFFPSFVIIALIGPFIPRLRKSSIAQAFLRGVNAAVVALILSTSLVLFRSAVIDVWTGLIMLGSLGVLRGLKINATWLVLAGGTIGLAHYLLRGG